MAEKPPLHVAVAVIFDAEGRVLVALREKHRHQGGKWEFPGGKVEAGESIREALVREIHEEVGIAIEECQPLQQLEYSYPERTVLLDVWQVERFSGEARGCEGQQIRWLFPNELDRYEFPAANLPIIRGLQSSDT